MTNILAIRPEPGLTSTLTAALAMGLDIEGQPLFEIHPLEWDCPDPDHIDALLIGSANAILHGGEQLETLKDKPVYAVGETTASAARDAGFDVALAGTGGLQNVLDNVEPPARLLRIAGAEHVPLDPQGGVTIEVRIAYESRALPFIASSAWEVDGSPIVLLHSAAAAQHFARECDRLGLNRSEIALAALGPRIAKAAGDGWRSVHVAPHPNDAALLEMTRDICI